MSLAKTNRSDSIDPRGLRDRSELTRLAMDEQLATPPAARRLFKLQAQNVTDADISRVATYVRDGRDRLNCDWKIVFNGELHVLLVGGDEPDTIFGMLDSPLAVLRLVDPGTTPRHGANTLRRPLQYEDFIEALLDLECKLGDMTTAPVNRQTLPVGTPSAGPLAIASVLQRHGAYRLRCWPPASVLKGHRDHLRLASCLSTRHVTLEELTRFSNVKRRQCEALLIALLAAGVLDVRTAGTAQPAPVANGSEMRRDVAASTAPQSGLLSRIRRGLGMAWRR
jgi:hypothetical protein